jgi:MFS family permease
MVLDAIDDYLTRIRLRWFTHGLNQCCAELHLLLQSPKRRKQRYWNRLRHIPNRSDDRRILLLGVGLARSSMANLCCVGTCVGAVVTSVAPTIPAFIGGRFLLSFFSTIATTAAPLYLIEIAPPQYRGTVAGMYNTLYYLVSVPLDTAVTHLLTAFAGIDYRNICGLFVSEALGK